MKRQARRQLARATTRNEPLETLVLVPKADTPEARQLAYKVLGRSDTLLVYFRQFKYADAKQKAVALGGFTLNKVPQTVARRIESELSTGWHKGAMPKPQVDPVVKAIVGGMK